MNSIDNTINPEEYFLRKEELLKKCINMEETLLSSVDDYEALDDIISEIGNILEEIQNLDDSYEVDMMELCSTEQKSTIDQLSALMLALNKDAVKLILNQQKNVLASMKTNLHQQKLASYSQQSSSESGRVLDCRK